MTPQQRAIVLLREARDELTEAAAERHPQAIRDAYPSEKARWMRDMELPERINAALAYFDREGK